MKLMLTIAIASFALPTFAQAQVSCSPKNGSKSLQVTIEDEANQRAQVLVNNSNGSRLVVDKEVHSVYNNGYTAYSSADGQFYLLVHQAFGDSKLILTDDAGQKVTADLNCNSL
jgi:hypothetical protein